MTIREVLQQTDWALLAKQKQRLVELDGDQPNDDQLLGGLVGFLDAIQDAADMEGYSVVLPTGEHES